MMKKTLSTLAVIALCAGAALAAPMGTAFTYQGRLNDGGAPANKVYDLTFTLHDDPVNVASIGTYIILSAVPVTNGLFTVQLNTNGEFGTNAFNGESRWLQIGVRTNSSNVFNNFTFLTPRQPLDATPQALFALNASSAVNASNAVNASFAATVADGAITSAKLADGSVGAQQLAPGLLSWSSLADIPAGFADGVDNSGASYSAGAGLSLSASNEFSVNFGTNGIATAAARADHQHFDEEWIGASDRAGLTITNAGNGMGFFGVGAATNGFSAGVLGASTSPQGYGVAGIATSTNGLNYGVAGQSYSEQGIGIYGYATSTNGGIGVGGQSDGANGAGVIGAASAASGINYGVFGQSISPQGYGVHGISYSTTGTNSGVLGQSDSASGHGVVGKANAATGINFGVRGESASTQGTGVSGKTTAATGINFGVRGETASTGGYGVHGLATAKFGTTAGVIGQSDSTSGWGIRGLATGGSGATAGVQGEAYSSQGFGVLARNDNGVALKAAGTGIIQSDADSYIWIPGSAGIGDWRPGSDKVVCHSTSLIVFDRGYKNNHAIFPLTLPAVAYGQSTVVKSIEIWYHCRNGARGFIKNTALTASYGYVLLDSVARQSSSTAGYTITPTPSFVSTSGFLTLELEFYFNEELDSEVWIHGIKVRLGHK